MNQHNRAARLCRLFFSTLYISSFTFGGGFVIVTLMKKKFVDELHWITEEEMLDMTALAESAPGAIAVNAAILVGWQVEGLLGMITAVVGTILPPMVILSIISYFYNVFAANVYVALVLKGMQAGVAAVILDVVCSMGGKVIASHSAVSLFLINNTISVAAAFRRQECQIMRLIGATNFMIRAPFVVQGVMIGLVGALIPLAITYFLYRQAVVYMMERFDILSNLIEFIPIQTIFPSMVAVAMALGVGIGFVGSFFTIRRHLKV